MRNFIMASDQNIQMCEKVSVPSSAVGRTSYTTETLRLEARDVDRTNTHLQPQMVGAGNQSFQNKKVSSFQITSVTSRSSNDGGDDSENDTEDTSDNLDCSKVTVDPDQETPSFSEEYSRSEDVLYGPAPVFPTNSQYGITALVQQTGDDGVMTARLPQGVTVNVTEGGIALAKAEGGPVEIDNWENRFKIVKINTNKPCKRGRWVCLDFNDSPAVSASGSSGVKGDELPNVVIGISNISVSDKENADQSNVFHIQVPVTMSSYQQVISHGAPEQFSTFVYTNQPAVPLSSASHIPGRSINIQPAPQASQPSPSQAQSSVQFSQTGGQQVVQSYPPSNAPTQGNINIAPAGQPAQGNVAHPNQSATSGVISSQGDLPSLNTSLPQVLIPVSIPPGLTSSAAQVSSSSTVSQSSQQSVSQPTQLRGIPSTIGQSNIMGQSTITSQGLQHPIIGISSQGQPSSCQTTGVMTQPSQGAVPTQVISQAIPCSQTASQGQQVTSAPHVPLVQSQISSAQQVQETHPVSSSSIIGQQVVGGTHSASQLGGVTSSYSQIPPAGVLPASATTPAQTQGHMTIPSGQPSTEILSQVQTAPQTMCQSAPVQQHPATLDGLPKNTQTSDGQGSGAMATPSTTVPQEDTESFSGLAKALSHVSFAPSPEESSNEATKSVPSFFLSPKLTSPYPCTSPVNTPPLVGPASYKDAPEAAAAALSAAVRSSSCEGNLERTSLCLSASAASTVAIDNKIEQAMDLVKSHLMFAVREEVEVLKERIGELMERINHLECENTVLRQYASPEVMQQIQQQLQQPHHSSNS